MLNVNYTGKKELMKTMVNKIFVVDDTVEILEFIKLQFEISEINNVQYYSNPSTALSNIKDENIPDIIISDFQMPKLSGPEFIDQAKAINPDLFAVIMTSDENNAFLTGYPVIFKRNLLTLCDDLVYIVKNEYAA